jgi:Asp-tRNA(Asn)/Glu-tRNA(Gln) amidotransferase A subunit family amidase
VELDDLTIARTPQLFKRGDLNATSLCQACLDRINSIDCSGPTLRSVLELTPDARCSAPPAMAGYPHVTVPAGFRHGLPVALSFFGKAWQDGKLLGYAFEQATQARRAPAFKPTVAV